MEPFHYFLNSWLLNSWFSNIYDLLKVGMNPAWMLSDADREERRKRRKGQQQQQQQQQQSNSKEVVYVQGLRAAPEILFTAEELLQLQRIISQ